MRFRRLHAFVALVISTTAILISISGCATRLLVAGGGSEQIHRYDGSTGAPLGVFVPAGSGGLVEPRGLVFGPDGNLYVAGRKAVFRYNGNTGAFIDAFVPETGGLEDAHGLVFGPDGDLYVTNTSISAGEGDAVRRYNGNTGAFVEGFVKTGSGGLFLPLRLVFIARPVTKQIDTLLVAVGNLRLPADTEKGFKNPLQNARAAIDAGAVLAARNQLDAFTDTVRPNLGNLIPQPQGNRLISAADALRAQLRCL